MSVFYLKNEKVNSVYAPCDGTVLPGEILEDIFNFDISEVGFLLLPSSAVLYSPIDGVLSDISDDLTTYTLKANDGAEVVVKIGSEELYGDGLHTLAIIGQPITVTDPMCSFEADVFERYNVPTVVAVSLINSERFRAITVFEGACRSSVTEVMSFIDEINGYRLLKI